MALDKQIQILSVDTGNFYTCIERQLHWRNHKHRGNYSWLKTRANYLKSVLLDLGYSESELQHYLDDWKYIPNSDNNNTTIYSYATIMDRHSRDVLLSIADIFKEYKKCENLKVYKRQLAVKSKNKLLYILQKKFDDKYGKYYHDEKADSKAPKRILREDTITEKNIISIFDSSNTRTFGNEINQFSDDMIVMQIYYFSVFKDTMFFNFLYKNEEYSYYTSSAGQIRTKKAVFIKKSTWDTYIKTMMCGLTLDKINHTCVGTTIDENENEINLYGNNANKHLAYTALSNSATEEWKEFDIDKCIVIDDFESDVFGEFDYIDDSTYEIKRVQDYAHISHTDGSGMVDPSILDKNAMVRLPWIKGLLGSFAWRDLVLEKGWSTKIVDIYGKEYDVFDDDIYIIFTKSQFKLWKYYNSWDEYKQCFKQYNCQAGLCNIEEERIKNATINYQMLQTLTDFTDDELKDIAQKSIDKLNNLCSSEETLKSFFGVTPYNSNPTSLQQAIKLYPSLINDNYMKEVIRGMKNSLVKQYKAGRLEVNGKYTFVLPDFYAACEHWFGGIENPDGLLKDQEVYCKLYRHVDELDCLRSPHLFKEHAVRINMAYRHYATAEMNKWFNTNAIYTSCHDLISRILQFDVDGDKLLVVSDKTLILVAKRNMNGIVPLYYIMKKAEPVRINSENLYNGLMAAFKYGNIGIYSNDISKIWNSEIFVTGTEEQKQEAINAVKLLCMENNYCIDAAKTLYMPKRPKEIHRLISSFTKEKLPSFFRYAKDKTENQVNDSEICKGTFVNRLEEIIPNPRLDFRKANLGAPDYKLMMHNPKIVIDEKVIERYKELNSKYHWKVNMKDENDKNMTNIYFYVKREMLKVCESELDIADMLVEYLYGNERKWKELLWFCYGSYIVDNLEDNLKPKQTKYIQCVDCGEWIEIDVKNTKTCRCDTCQKIKNKELKKLRNQKYYQNNKIKTLPN